MLLSQLLAPQKLRRQSADRATIALSLVLCGRLDDADQRLAPTIAARLIDTETVNTRGVLAVAHEDLASPLRRAEVRMGLRGLVHDQADAHDDALYQVLTWTRLTVGDVGYGYVGTGSGAPGSPELPPASRPPSGSRYQRMSPMVC